MRKGVLLGVDSVLIGVLLGAAAREAYRLVARGGCSVRTAVASVPDFDGCHPPVPGSRSGNVTVSWQVPAPAKPDRVQAAAMPDQTSGGPRQPVGKLDGRWRRPT